MKKLALAGAFAFAATSAFAGNLDAPIIEEEPAVDVIIEEETASSAGGVIVPIIFLVFAGAVIAN